MKITNNNEVKLKYKIAAQLFRWKLILTYYLQLIYE